MDDVRNAAQKAPIPPSSSFAPSDRGATPVPDQPYSCTRCPIRLTEFSGVEPVWPFSGLPVVISPGTKNNYQRCYLVRNTLTPTPRPMGERANLSAGGRASYYYIASLAQRLRRFRYGLFSVCASFETIFGRMATAGACGEVWLTLATPAGASGSGIPQNRPRPSRVSPGGGLPASWLPECGYPTAGMLWKERQSASERLPRRR